MNWIEYKELSEKTLSTEFHCDEKKIELLLHAVVGILTETEELLDNHLIQQDKTNILEEIGDITWYLAIIGREYNMDFPTDLPLSNEDPMKIVISIIKQTCKLLDMLKKKLFYNKPINDELFKQITTLVMILTQSYMNYYSIDIKGSFDINISKLKSRYGSKFSSDKAINRDLETERKILEGEITDIPHPRDTSSLYLD
jgi:NTP pyrophosphatase (non-canonical NTP hydrolase)